MSKYRVSFNMDTRNINKDYAPGVISFFRGNNLSDAAVRRVSIKERVLVIDIYDKEQGRLSEEDAKKLCDSMKDRDVVIDTTNGTGCAHVFYDKSSFDITGTFFECECSGSGSFPKDEKRGVINYKMLDMDKLEDLIRFFEVLNKNLNEHENRHQKTPGSPVVSA